MELEQGVDGLMALGAERWKCVIALQIASASGERVDQSRGDSGDHGAEVQARRKQLNLAAEFLLANSAETDEWWWEQR
jgi:hypothetical protein